ncbi:MAG: phasin family protein [Betaproteobacteria bacterium]|nr:phasin family protein [Betaproteobacteria bacterium]
MTITPEQIFSANKTNIEAALSIASAQFTTMEKLASLQSATLKSIFEDVIANTRAMAGAKDAKEFIAMQKSFAQPSVEKAVAYSKSVYAIAVEANAELSKFAESKASELNQSIVTILDKAGKNAPVGSDVGVAAVKSMLSAANSAYDTFTKAAKQATEMAETNVAAATQTVQGFAKAKKAA